MKHILQRIAHRIETTSTEDYAEIGATMMLLGGTLLILGDVLGKIFGVVFCATGLAIFVCAKLNQIGY